MRSLGITALFFLAWALPENEFLSAAETNAFVKKFSFQLTGRGELAEHTVLVKDSDFFFSSDDKGNLYSPLDKSEKEFAFTNGRYRFEVVFRSGRLEKEIAIDDTTPRLVLIDVSSLKTKRESTRKLEELQVNASGRREDSSRSVLTAGEARFIPGSGGDALRSLSSFPGVAPTSQFASGLFIRGGDRFDVLYTYDTIRLGNPFHVISFYSVFPTSAVESVDFYPGAFPTRFGNSQGAVVEVKSKTSYDKTKIIGDFDVNLALGGGYLSIPLGKYFQLSIGGRRSYFEFYLDLIKSVKAQGVKFLEDIQKTLTDVSLIPYFYDFNGKLDFQINRYNTVSIVSILSHDKLSLNSDKFPDPQNNTNTFAISLEREESWDAEGVVYHFDNNKIRNSTSLFRYYNTNTFSIQGVNLLAGHTENYSLVNNFSWQAANFLNLGLGVEAIYQTYPFSVPEFISNTFSDPNQSIAARLNALKNTPTIRSNRSPIRDVYAGYFDTEWKFGPFTLTPGLRITANSINRWVDLDPRVQFSWQVVKPYEVFAKWGIYSQLPQLIWVTPGFGYKDLKSSYAIHYVLGNRLVAGKFEIKAEAYYKDFEMLPLNNPSFDLFFPSDQNNPRYVNEGRGTSYGLELLIRRKFADGVFGWLSYTLSRADRQVFNSFDNNSVITATNLDVNDGLQYKNIGKNWVPFSQDVTHNLTFIGSVEVVPRHIKMGVRVNLSSGNPYTERVVVTNTNGGLTTAESADKFTGRFPVHFTIDYRIDFTFSLFKKLDFSIYLDIWNLQYFFYKNAAGYTPPADEKLTRDQLGKVVAQTATPDLPIVPLLGISLQF